MNLQSATDHPLWVLLLALGCVISCSGVRSRLNGEKANQIMRDIRSAETTFNQGHAKFGGLKELIEAGLLRNSIADGIEVDHRFEMRANANKYEVVGIPLEKDDRYHYVGWSFYLDESGVIRGSAYGKASGYVVAGKSDPPVRSQ